MIVMDCDLQHPPEVIPQMWEKWQQGAEIVEGIKSDRGRESLGYKLSAGLFYKIMSKLIKMDMNASSDFKLLDRKVVRVLLELPERNTFFRALTFWAGFQTETVEYEVQERQYGQSKWSFWSLMKYAITNATSFSTLPLQLVTIMGMISIFFQRGTGNPDTGTICHGNSCGRLHHRDPADPDHRRLPDAESWDHRTLHCQNL